MVNRNLNISILGVSFSTGNLGVSALAWSSVNLIYKKWPDANLYIIGGVEGKTKTVLLNNKEVKLKYLPVRHSPKLFIKNHILWMLMASIVPFGKQLFAGNSNTLDVVRRSDIFLDITAGDSFSDIYGLRRMRRLYFEKILCMIVGKPFVMLPQTYGPFKSLTAKKLAKKILGKASLICSRDKDGLTCVQEIIGKSDKLYLCPDIAFTLEPRIPSENYFKKKNSSTLIGLNISGLLYNGGYSGKNEFGLGNDYKQMINDIIAYFVNMPGIEILLIPHVVPENWTIENDLLACREFRASLPEKLQNQVFIAEPENGPFYDQCEIKYIIGQCDFFMGSRMHATIAAISQCIPTVGLAYSKKFAGVYETAGIDDCVVDLRKLDNRQVIGRIQKIYETKNEIKQRLLRNIPEVKKQVYALFDNLNI